MLFRLTEVMGGGVLAGHGRFFQNGVKYRTICAKCNNERLGAQFDPALIDFSRSIATAIEGVVARPRFLRIPIQPQRVARAVAGHLLAVGLNRLADGTMERAMAKYFLDPEQRSPEGVFVYTWIYPHSTQVTIRGAGRVSLQHHRLTVFELIKFFPCAFLFTTDVPALPPAGMHQLTFENSSLDAIDYVLIDLHQVPPHNWPEAPRDYEVVLMGDEALAASREMGKKILW